MSKLPENILNLQDVTSVSDEDIMRYFYDFLNDDQRKYIEAQAIEEMEAALMGLDRPANQPPASGDELKEIRLRVIKEHVLICLKGDDPPNEPGIGNSPEP